MPTKPDPVTDLPPLWGGAGNYPVSNYPAFLPWGQPNPETGQTLWSLQPRLNSDSITSFANNGLTPQVATPASKFNEWLRRVGIWQTNWVSQGTFDPDADAHIMETDVSGFAYAQKYVATLGVEGAGTTPVILVEGATVPATKSIALVADASITGGVDTVVETGILAFQVGAPAPASSGSLAANANGDPVWLNATGLRIGFGGPNGAWVGQDADQVPETGLSASTLLPTTSKVDVSGLLRVRVRGEIQRSVAGAVTISLEQDQGTSTWVAIDNGGVTTKGVTSVDTSDANDWTPFQMERTFGSGATDTFFRLNIAAGGGNSAKIRETHLTVRRQGA